MSPTVIQDILTWQAAHAGQVTYSETAATRLDYDSAHLTSPTDCSGMAIRMLKHFGGDAMQTLLAAATYTGNLCQLGEHVTSSHADAANGSGMRPGDLIFFTWSGHNPTWDHVAIYAGAGRIWNHGGPGPGPLDWSLAQNVYAASEVMVRRYITHDTDLSEENPLMADKLTPAVVAQIEAAVRSQLNLFTPLDGDDPKDPKFHGHQIRTIVQDEVSKALAPAVAKIIKAVDDHVDAQTGKLAHSPVFGTEGIAQAVRADTVTPAAADTTTTGASA